MAQRTISSKFIIVIITITALLLLKLPVMAEPQPTEDEHIKELLEKSLSVVEIDKEIERIQAQKLVLEEDMAQTRLLLANQEEQIADKREAAGKVLRAYYMGDRNILLQALLSFNSLPDLFAMLDYIDIIIAQDKLAITTYKEHYRQLQSGYSKMEDNKEELQSVESRLRTQRDRVLALEQQIDTELAGRSDGERLRLMMQELTTYWETAGLGEVELYFGALSKAMQQLPTWIQDNKEYLEIDGFNYTIRVPQDALNLFLREQDDRFDTFSFVFEDDKVTAQGMRDGMELSITGHYTVENEPDNGIIFHVDELLFNGFALPDTTRQTLEDQFDLGFYPSLIISFLKATSVETKDGELIIKLSVKL